MKKKKQKKIAKRRQAKTNKRRSKKKQKKPFSFKREDFFSFEDQLLPEPQLTEEYDWKQTIFFDAKKFRIAFHDIPITEEEEDVIDSLKYFDMKIMFPDDSFNYQDYLSSLSHDIPELFSRWCLEKGIDRTSAQIFSACVRQFFSYIYKYKDSSFYFVNNIQLDQFLFYYLNIENPVDLTRYSFTLKALELLYRFLKEKGYLRDVANVAYMIQGQQTEFDQQLMLIIEKVKNFTTNTGAN